MAAQGETRTHLLSLCRRGDAIQVWQQSALKRGIDPSCHLHGPIQVGHPSECRGDGRNSRLPFRVRSYLLSGEAVPVSQIVLRGLESISKAGSFNKMVANCFTNKYVLGTKGRAWVLKPANSHHPKGH